MNTTRSILPATKSLLAEISGKADFVFTTACKNTVLCFGSKADADEVLNQFIEDPSGPFAGDLLEIVGKWGDIRHARKIYEVSIADDRLHANFPENVLEILGQLKFEAAKPVLARYVFECTEYYLNKAAVLGLLHFDCEEYTEEIRKSIINVLDKNLFPEYLPALISKLKNRKELLEELYNSGSTIISTDCNAGIFLGFSLCGKEGRPYFKKALFDPNWEAFYNAASMVLKGMQHLGISFGELLQEANDLKDEKVLQYYMLVIISLLEIRTSSYTGGESFEKIYRELLATGTFPALAEKAGQLADAEKVKELIIIRMNQELMLNNRT